MISSNSFYSTETTDRGRAFEPKSKWNGMEIRFFNIVNLKDEGASLRRCHS